MGATNRGRNRELGEEKTKETREESFSKREKNLEIGGVSFRGFEQ